MLLAIDAGNTNTVFAVFDGEKLKGSWRLSTDPQRTSDEHALNILKLLEISDVKPEEIKDVIIASVVPHSLFNLRSLCRKYFNVEPKVIGEGLKLGINIILDRPSEVGADRLVNAIAAYEKYKRASIIIDFGTATTFDVINDKGDYLGGAISPGINLSLEALYKAAAKLPEVAIERPDKVIGSSTITAMQSGIYWGYVGLIEGIIERIKGEYRHDMETIATGGLSSIFVRATPLIHRHEPDLTILGLKIIYERNKQ